MEMRKNNEGVTLIVLVVSIIIILILSVVGVTMVVGKNRNFE